MGRASAELAPCPRRRHDRAQQQKAGLVHRAAQRHTRCGVHQVAAVLAARSIAESVLAERRIRSLEKCHGISPQGIRVRGSLRRTGALSLHSIGRGKAARRLIRIVTLFFNCVVRGPVGRKQFHAPIGRRQAIGALIPRHSRHQIFHRIHVLDATARPCAMQFMAAAAQEKSSCRSSGHSCIRP